MDSLLSYHFISIFDNIKEKQIKLEKNHDFIKQDINNIRENLQNQLNDIKQDFRSNIEALLTSTDGKLEWNIHWPTIKNNKINKSPRFFANKIRCSLELDNKGWAIFVIQETDNPAKYVKCCLIISHLYYYNQIFENKNANKTCGWYINTDNFRDDIKYIYNFIIIFICFDNF
jgi:hypothetical protein